MNTTELRVRIAQAMEECLQLLEAVPDTMAYTSVRNKLVATSLHLDNARDAVSAAADRYTETQDHRA